jgi:hypothetical protein
MKWLSDHMRPLSQIALIAAGVGVIIAGCVLMFNHQSQQAAFQNSLLAMFKTEYHWRSIGDAYTGIAAVAVGAGMMAVGAIVARFG